MSKKKESVATTLRGAWRILKRRPAKKRFPVTLRGAYTLKSFGERVAKTEVEFDENVQLLLSLSPTSEVCVL